VTFPVPIYPAPGIPQQGGLKNGRLDILGFWRNFRQYEVKRNVYLPISTRNIIRQCA
jgi:hypothetical protein